MLLWGLISTLSGVVHNYVGMVLTRFFLGFVEGESGVSPYKFFDRFVADPLQLPSFPEPCSFSRNGTPDGN